LDWWHTRFGSWIIDCWSLFVCKILYKNKIIQRINTRNIIEYNCNNVIEWCWGSGSGPTTNNFRSAVNNIQTYYYIVYVCIMSVVVWEIKRTWRYCIWFSTRYLKQTTNVYTEIIWYYYNNIIKIYSVSTV